MTSLLLKLGGPMQAWGDSSQFSRRDTRTEPTKSGVLGLLAAADGRRRTDPIEDLTALRFGVRIDQRGELMRDFQTAHHLDTGAPMPLSYRFYLSDAVFVAAVEGESNLIEGLAEAVQAPAFPLYLGRRSCPPASPVFLAVSDRALEPALREVEWQAAAWYRARQPQRVHLELRLDKDENTPADSVTYVSRDDPISFDPRRRLHGDREVVHANPVSLGNPSGRDEIDFLSAYGGH